MDSEDRASEWAVFKCLNFTAEVIDSIADDGQSQTRAVLARRATREPNVGLPDFRNPWSAVAH